MADLVNLDQYFDGTAYRIPDNPVIRKALMDQIVIPSLVNLGKVIYRKNGDLSKSRGNLPEIYIGGKRQALSSVSNYVKEQIKPTGKKVKRPSFSDIESKSKAKSARKEAGKGFSTIGRKQADFYNEIERLRKNRDRKLSRTNGTKARINIKAKFDKDMAKLFHDNRDWLIKDNNRPLKYDPNDADSYGWPKGLSEKGYLDWQSRTYKDQGERTRAFFAEHGIEVHSGHAFSAKGLKVTPEMLSKLDIPTQQLIRADGEPDGEGNYIVKGTNSVSNLAIEVAKKNLSHGKDITRTIEDLVELNVAFTKTGSLQEYLNTGNFNYRKSEDFHEVTRNFLYHSEEDINAVIARGEDELLLKGPPEEKKMKNTEGKIKPRPLANVTESGPVTVHKYDPNNMPEGGLVTEFGRISKKDERPLNTVRKNMEKTRYQKDMEAYNEGLKRDEKILHEMNAPNRVLQTGSKIAEAGLRATVPAPIVQTVDAAKAVDKALKGDLTDVAVGVAGNVIKDAVTTTTPYYGLPGS